MMARVKSYVERLNSHQIEARARTAQSFILLHPVALHSALSTGSKPDCPDVHCYVLLPYDHEPR